MAEHLLGKRQAERHQEDRPVNRMETDNILSDQMQVCRPQFFKLLCTVSVRVIADSGNIVGKGVKPHICDMLRVKINGNSPFE